MQITKYTLNKTHFSWGETISGTVTFKMGSNEQIRANYNGAIELFISPLMSRNGELLFETDGDGTWSGGLWAPHVYGVVENNVSVGKGVTKTVNFEFTFPQKSDVIKLDDWTYEEEFLLQAQLENIDLTSNDRLQPYFVITVNAYDEYGNDGGSNYYAEKVDKLSGGFFFKRLAPQISNFKIIDRRPGNLHESTRAFLLGGQSKLEFSCYATLDPLDPNLTATQKAEISRYIADSGEVVFSEASGELGSVLTPALPMETGNAVGWQSVTCRMIVTDSAGVSSSVSDDANLFDYASPPQLSALTDYELAERYSEVTTDEGGTEYVASDEGQNVRLSFKTSISRIATTGAPPIEGLELGPNKWYLDISYGETGGEMTTKASVLSGTDMRPTNAYVINRALLQGVVFEPTKKYTIILTLRDEVDNKSILTTYIDKAGGYFNVERYGVAVGMRSTGTPENPIFECNYPAYFYGGIFLSEEGKQELIKELLDAMSGCTYLNWIESSGTQYIDTGLKPTNLTGFDIDFITYNDFTGSSYGAVFGARQGSKAKEYQMSTFTMSSGGGILRYGASEYDPKLKKGERTSATLRNGVFSSNLYDGFTVAAQTFTSPVNLTVFALNNNGSVTQHGKVRIYSMKIYNGDLLIRDFVPAQRNADAAIGFYDHVTREFYENKGTGTFTYG